MRGVCRDRAVSYSILGQHRCSSLGEYECVMKGAISDVKKKGICACK